MSVSAIKRFGITLASISLLAACGGGGGGGSTIIINPKKAAVAPPTTAITGVYDGKIDSVVPMTTVLLDDNSYFIVYSDASAPKSFQGAVMGPGVFAGSSLSSTSGSDVSLIGTGIQDPTPPTTSLSASVTAKQSFNGTLTYTATNVTKTLTSNYNAGYESLPSLQSIAGVYVGSIATTNVKEDKIELTIAADGKISAKLTCGCEVTATLVPRADGKAYDATLDFTGGNHPLADKAMSGNVYIDLVSNRIYIAGKIVGTGEYGLFVGNKS